MEAVQGIPLKRLLSECRGQSRLIELPRPHYLYQGDYSIKQDVHKLPCIVRGCQETCKRVHPVCGKHAREYFHLEVRQSTIPGAGRGVFVLKSVKHGTHIMDYTGLCRNSARTQRLYESANCKSVYKIAIDDKYAIDGRSTCCGIGRWLNHSSDPNRVNTSFEYDEENRLFRIIAEGDILVPVGGRTELFVDYGDCYWYEEEPREAPPLSSSDSSGYEAFIEPRDWPVFPAYATVKYNSKLPRCRQFSSEELLSLCRHRRVLLPTVNPSLMTIDKMDLRQRETVVKLDCIIVGCRRQCKYAHPLCSVHLADYGIQIGASTVPGGGRGVFLTKSAPSNCVIMSFTGCCRSREAIYECYRREKSEFYYAFEGAAGVCIDARSTMCGIARYINHHPNTKKANVELVSEKGHQSFFVRTKREIPVPVGGCVELFLNYGEQYWRNGRKCDAPKEEEEEDKDEDEEEEDEEEDEEEGEGQKKGGKRAVYQPVDVNFPCVPAYESVP